MNKLFFICSLLLANPLFAQRTGAISWDALFEIQDAPPGPIRNAKITSRFFKRLEKEPNIWQRDMSQVREQVEYEWTEELHLNPGSAETIIFITTEPVEFERLLGLLTAREGKDELGKYKQSLGFTALEPKQMTNGGTISQFTGGNRLVEVLSSHKGNIEEWIFQISKTRTTKDLSPPVITILEPAGTRSMGETVLDRTRVKIKVADESGIKNVLFDGSAVALQPDGTYSKIITLSPAVSQKQITIQATDNHGNKALTQFYVAKKIEANVFSASDQAAIQDIASGRYHALLISVQKYNPGFGRVEYPHKDAEELAKVLTTRYGFNPNDLIRLKDPTREELGQVMGDLRKKLNRNDNLLILFSGHGVYDSTMAQGFWLLRDAELENLGTYLSNSTVRDYIRTINTQHTLLIADACFSGSMARGDFSAQTIYKRPSRVVMTSGNLEKVPDKSVFMKYLLERLQENNARYLPARTLFNSFIDAVIGNPGDLPAQVPQCNILTNTGDQGGDFIFSLK